ncbi:outer membrane lipoprotein-sorting protein [uncultured Desulfobacter sp.]|uniref:outer membrane lipoprotein-sorting protein n=1 Tax=uncultured Desulfobacter sp. TaxID=240139 RepID=UPI002AAA6986|nr:outer membrane lipoprotein-sorting protein [uncultured Desulfobacter sp.]
MKKQKVTIWIRKEFLILILLILSSAWALADDPDARKIMEQVDARQTGDNRVAQMEMILTDKNGSQRIRKIQTFIKDKGPDTMSLMFFLTPADVHKTAFLNIDYDDPNHDDDQWLYLPALKKTKRIASADKSGSFMGSDMNYSDMTDRELTDYDYSFYEKGREQVFDNIKTWAIWAIPRSDKVIKETGYEKELLFVRQDNDVVTRSIGWVENSPDLKYMTVRQLDIIDGIWVATSMQITRKKGKQTVHKTDLILDRVKFNQDLDEGMFSVRQMEKGL